MKPRGLWLAGIAADAIMLASLGILAIALTGNFPLSGAYSSPFGPVKAGPKPAIWIGLFLFSALARITIRKEGGRVSALITHPTSTRLFLFTLFIYNANGRTIGAGDTVASRLLPYSILREGNFDLDEFSFLYAHGIPGYLLESAGHLVSAYPPGTAILAIPFYLLPFLGGVPPESNLLVHVEKLAGAVFVSLSVALIFVSIRKLEDEKAALALSIVYAFGTSSFSISSQALWQHGPSQALLAASILFLVMESERAGWAAWSGLTLSLAILCRPTDLAAAVPLAIYVFHSHRAQALRFTLLALPPILFLGLYNSRYFGSVFRIGYDQGFFSGMGWGTSLLEGLSGILLSPSRGLLIYSPVFLFSLIGIFLAWRIAEPSLMKFLSVSTLLTILVYSRWSVWWGGWAFGPRLLADLTPILTILLIPAFRRIGPHHLLRVTFFALAGASIAIHSLGAFVPVGWSPDVGQRSHRLWSWSDGELMDSLRKLRSKFTGRDYPLNNPKLSVSIDRIIYRPGETVSITLTLHGGMKPDAFDGYLQVLREGKPIGFLTFQGLHARASSLITVHSTDPSDAIRVPLWLSWDLIPGKYGLRGLIYQTGTPSEYVGSERGRLFVSVPIAFSVRR